jgi:Cu(I)/Ag(I) efflux system membrane fusion protein/cobalt-zinc-cadmium efflux system membrane fusion protein
MKTSTAGGGASASSGDSGERKVAYWVAPMDPTYIRDEPGNSPMGMDLVPVYEDELEGGAASGGSVVAIDPVVVQNMGVRIAPVVRGSLSRHVRTIGEIEVAEDSLSVVNLRYSGWIEKIYVDETGEEVRKGQRLFDIYSPELVSAQDEYLLALRTAGEDSPLASSARKRLELWNLSDTQIQAIADAGESQRTVTIYAPRGGYVLHKNVVEGARITAGHDLYRIGDLASIWALAEVYEFDAPWVGEGQAATMELSFAPGETYAGHVSYVYPTLNETSRTLKVRLEFENPGLALRPGMFATVWIEAQRRDDVLMVPSESILHGGDRQTVFVAQGGGRYRSQSITTGLSGDNKHTEVLSGLAEGDQVVVSGQFLLDSESQLQEAVAKLLAARLEANQKHEKEAAGHDHGDPADPDSYWTCPMHPEVVQDGPGDCPICGMDLVEKER